MKEQQTADAVSWLEKKQNSDTGLGVGFPVGFAHDWHIDDVQTG